MGGLLSELGHEVVQRDPAYGAGGIEFTQIWLRGIYEESAQVPDHSVFERSTRQFVGGAGARLDLRPPAREAAGPAGRRRRWRVWQLRAGGWTCCSCRYWPAPRSPPEGAYGKSAPLAMDQGRSPLHAVDPLFNVTGQPSIALPAGFGADGLPLSVQLIGRPGAEDLLYSLAGQVETPRGRGRGTVRASGRPRGSAGAIARRRRAPDPRRTLFRALILAPALTRRWSVSADRRHSRGSLPAMNGWSLSSMVRQRRLGNSPDQRKELLVAGGTCLKPWCWRH